MNGPSLIPSKSCGVLTRKIYIYKKQHMSKKKTSTPKKEAALTDRRREILKLFWGGKASQPQKSNPKNKRGAQLTYGCKFSEDTCS
jgi:hypothetical protein